jgi:hypothetical protein
MSRANELIFPKTGDVFYLRVLLFNLPARSFVDYRTVNGIVHSTFQTAAVARGYLSDENEALWAFNSVVAVSTLAELRATLVMLTVERYPTLCIIQNRELFATMYDDYLHYDKTYKGNVELAKNMCLLDLKRRFDVHGQDIMQSCGFPEPKNMAEMTELERIRLKFKLEEQKKKLETLVACFPNTAEQDAAFDKIKVPLQIIKNCSYSYKDRLVQGKQSLQKEIAAYVRSLGKICLGCAVTGLAAQVYGEDEEYTTAHDLFGVLVVGDIEDLDHDADIASHYLKNPEKLAILLAACVLIWDEALSNHKHCLATAFSLMNNFQGQILILMGDWRQCPPVVPNGDMYEIVNASMIFSQFWKVFSIIKFTTNL